MKIAPDRQQNKIAFDFIKNIISDGKERKLLDVGAADCVLKPFLPKNINYYSLDVKNYPNIKHNFLIDLDKKKIPVKNSFFDIVLCLEVLEHTMYPIRVINEIKRVAKENAVFVFSIPNEYNFLQRAYYLFAIKRETEKPWKVVEEHLHIHKPRISDAKKLMRDYFYIKKIRYNWESRHSDKNRLFAFFDKILNIFAQIWPNMFARDVVIMCINKSV